MLNSNPYNKKLLEQAQLGEIPQNFEQVQLTQGLSLDSSKKIESMSPSEATKELEQLDGADSAFESVEKMQALASLKQEARDKNRASKKVSMKTKKTQQEITAQQMMMLNGLDAKFKEKKNKSIHKQKEAPKDAEEDDMMGDILKKDKTSGDNDKKETDELQMMGGQEKEESSDSKPLSLQSLPSHKAKALAQEESTAEEPPKQENIELDAEQQTETSTKTATKTSKKSKQHKRKLKKSQTKKQNLELAQESVESEKQLKQDKIKNIFSNELLSSQEKLKQFNEKVCTPSLVELSELKDNRDIIPYVCYYNGMSLLKNSSYHIDSPQDLIKGLSQKKQFINNSHNSSSFAQQESCEEQLKVTFDKSNLDTLMPYQEKYVENKYLDIYHYFCKKQKKNMGLQQMYSFGIELQQKLDKIIDYDACNEEQAKSMGTADYCQELFKDQNSFIFWGDKDIIHHCTKFSSQAQSAAAGDKCASLNEGMFKKYHETQQNVLAELVTQSTSAIAQKTAKEEMLRQLVEDDDDNMDLYSPKVNHLALATESTNKELELSKEVCTFLSDFGDIDSKMCSDKPDSQKLYSTLKDLHKEYSDCAQKEVCKSQMKQNQLDNMKQLTQFIDKFDQINKSFGQNEHDLQQINSSKSQIHIQKESSEKKEQHTQQKQQETKQRLNPFRVNIDSPTVVEDEAQKPEKQNHLSDKKRESTSKVQSNEAGSKAQQQEPKPDEASKTQTLSPKKVNKTEDQPKLQQQTAEEKQLAALKEQMKLKTYIDKEISMKIKSVIQEQVTKLFSEYISKRESQELQDEKKFEDQQLQQMQNFQKQILSSMQNQYPPPVNMGGQQQQMPSQQNSNEVQGFNTMFSTVNDANAQQSLLQTKAATNFKPVIVSKEPKKSNGEVKQKDLLSQTSSVSSLQTMQDKLEKLKLEKEKKIEELKTEMKNINNKNKKTKKPTANVIKEKAVESNQNFLQNKPKIEPVIETKHQDEQLQQQELLKSNQNLPQQIIQQIPQMSVLDLSQQKAETTQNMMAMPLPMSPQQYLSAPMSQNFIQFVPPTPGDMQMTQIPEASEQLQMMPSQSNFLEFEQQMPEY